MLLALLVVAIGVIVAEVAAGSTRTVDRATAAVAAGAVGAVISALQRLNVGRIGLPDDFDRAPIVGAGASRTFVGAVFGAVVYCLFGARSL
jgi:hypothetical protein